MSVVVPVNPQTGAADPARTGFGRTLGAAWIRRLLCDAEVSRIVLDTTSEVLDAGRATRTFTAAMVRAIVARDRHCIWPGCDAPARWCDVHHGRRHWIDGGETSVHNGTLVVCGRHHDRVHQGRHAIIRRANGSYTVDRRPGSYDDP